MLSKFSKRNFVNSELPCNVLSQNKITGLQKKLKSSINLFTVCISHFCKNDVNIYMFKMANFFA